MTTDTIEDAAVLAELREGETDLWNSGQGCGPAVAAMLLRRLALSRREAREARDELRRQREVYLKGCECSAEDACLFARQRDEAAAVERERLMEVACDSCRKAMQRV